MESEQSERPDQETGEAASGSSRLSQMVWAGWWAGTILIVLSWSHVVSTTAGWIGFGVAGAATGVSVIATRYWRFPREGA